MNTNNAILTRYMEDAIKTGTNPKTIEYMIENGSAIIGKIKKIDGIENIPFKPSKEFLAAVEAERALLKALFIVLASDVSEKGAAIECKKALNNATQNVKDKEVKSISIAKAFDAYNKEHRLGIYRD